MNHMKAQKLSLTTYTMPFNKTTQTVPVTNSSSPALQRNWTKSNILIVSCVIVLAIFFFFFFAFFARSRLSNPHARHTNKNFGSDFRSRSEELGLPAYLWTERRAKSKFDVGLGV